MYQLVINNCVRENAEEISDFLEEFGALAVTMLDKFDDAILEPELGTMPLWPNVILNAIYPDDEDFDFLKQLLSDRYPDCIYSIDKVPEKEWEKECLVDFKPQKFGDKLLVCPSWITPPTTDTINLTLDPGLAFGTGAHSTTALCLTYLEKIDLKNKNIIDYGCGSGILGLAALKLGCKHVIAVDIDDQALLATKKNATTNNINDSQITIVKPELLTGKADIILANILLKTLIDLKSDFIKLLDSSHIANHSRDFSIKPNGLLVASGVLATQVEELITEFEPEFSLITIEYNGDWALLVFRWTHNK
ncbi:MAG: ribosomal protein L11 methyltransferase [Legionellales bacterium RIFCSPHIGHO2_12_FULL_35_11]|nr:MAG: ribosomal protein L11 methyltransferase [Legionellales bacterium RIFCSPHIGHO2_12_FULL_35_11]